MNSEPIALSKLTLPKPKFSLQWFCRGATAVRAVGVSTSSLVVRRPPSPCPRPPWILSNLDQLATVSPLAVVSSDAVHVAVEDMVIGKLFKPFCSSDAIALSKFVNKAADANIIALHMAAVNGYFRISIVYNCFLISMHIVLGRGTFGYILMLVQLTIHVWIWSCREDDKCWLFPVILFLFKSIQARFVNWHIANREIQDFSLFCLDPFWAHEPGL
ncbi:hypothetical protein Ahy_B09g099398 [Arachis hypogaea]|uniref:Uncharacterized protein n=1 Tax=Arachis hypogaea TaxID=3818 RepID=A0A444XTN4_ARAHY|nr:hypothetical protein Ahy_B09g099398 [Arachis hypogaea]